MTAKRAIAILHEWEIKQSGFSFVQREFEQAANEGKKALLCWLWMCGAINAGMSDEEIMKVVRQGFAEAADE